MAQKATERDEILLNGYKYRIKGGITGGWLDPFPDQYIIGDPDYASRRDLSSWIINDLRGGIGVEEMDEKKDWNKCWWTDCIIKFRNHILPPRLATPITIPTVTAATLTDGGLEDWTTGTNLTSWTETTSQGSVNEDTNNVQEGIRSAKLIVDDEFTTNHASISQSISFNNQWRGRRFEFMAYFKTGANCQGKFSVYDGTDTTTTTVAAEQDGYQTVAHTLNAAANELTVTLRIQGVSGAGANVNNWVDDVTINGQPVTGDILFANFNDELYMANGNFLSKLNEGRTAFEFLWNDFVQITALIPSLNNRLYIYLGDSDYYWYLGQNTIENCNDRWNESVDEDVTSEIDTIDKRDGSASVKLTVADGCDAGDILATEVISVDMTTYKTITLWAKSSVACAATNIKLLLDEDAKCASPDKTLSLPALVAGEWTKVSLDLGDVSALNAVISIGVEMDADKGAFTLYLDQIEGQTVTESDSANANWGFQYDAKLFKVNTSGTVVYSTDPDDATPDWTNSAGAITDIADQIEGFVVGRDASGAIVPYAATHSVLKAYDKTTPQWVDTEARLPNHPIGGKGHAYWNGKTYLSYGLGVKEYYPETGAFLDIGLTERDGIPVEFNGEIVKLLGDTGIKGMFAAIDASITSGNSASGLFLYDGESWQCWWTQTPYTNGVMHDIIVSSASSGYAVYWDCGGTIYYIDIPRGIENPDKISQSYGTACTLITSWFDAGNPVASKLAKVLVTYAKGVTTSSTVALKYRLDHTYTNVATGWTPMNTLNTTGESGYNEELFDSGAGVSFKAIQFRLDFVTAGSTTKADIQSLVLYFKKRTGSEKLRIWNVTIICDDYNPGNNPDNATAKQKVANLKSLVTSATDVLFSYHPDDASDESYYVTVDCPEFNEQTGREYEANYRVKLTES